MMINQQAEKMGKSCVLVSREPVHAETYLERAHTVSELAIDDVLIDSPHFGFPGETNA
jgi:hypothetical protein